MRKLGMDDILICGKLFRTLYALNLMPQTHEAWISWLGILYLTPPKHQWLLGSV
jgi:hypothetical protein